MQLKTPGGIERFVSTLATMFSDDFTVEIAANYGKPTDKLAFPLPSNIQLSFLTPKQPQEVSMKNLIKSLKWYKIPKELKRRYGIHNSQHKAFRTFLKSLDTNYIITDRALYSSFVGKYYHGHATKIATDHNYHQNSQKYVHTLLKSIKKFNYLILSTKELRDFYQSLTSVKCIFINNPLAQIPTKKSTLNSNNILSIGRFVPEKDFETLVEVMSEIHKQKPNVHLTIIGDGITMPQIKHKISTFNLEKVISLPGFLNQSDIQKYYYNSSIFVMTSKTEAFGLVLTEAMSYGLPCIAFARASGARAQITKNIGILIQNPSAKQMASAVIDLLDNHAKLLEYQSNINQAIQKYSISQVRDNWRKVVQ